MRRGLPDSRTMLMVNPRLGRAAAGRAAGFLARHWRTLAAAAIWLALAGSALGYSLLSGRPPTATLRDIVDLLRTPPGALLYLLVYTLRPLAFFSSTVVTVLGGALWGPLWGMLLAVVGSNMSATLAYGFGRAFGQGVLPTGGAGIAGRYAARLRANAFTTVLVMRLIYLPYDLVSYLGGLLRVPYRPFILASVLGSLPGTVAFVLAGASLDVDDVFAGSASLAAINPWTLAFAAGLFVAGLAGSRLLRRRAHRTG
jgi:uncharacterized membrane protein YdjX (TVP38/TMEM64 family)